MRRKLGQQLSFHIAAYAIRDCRGWNNRLVQDIDRHCALAARRNLATAKLEITAVTVEDNKAIVRAYMSDASDQTRPFEYGRYFSQNVMFNGVRSLDQLLARQEIMRAAFTGYRRIIEDQIGEGDKVVTRVTFEGVHTGEFNGVAPTGTSVKFRGVAIDRVEDGKVVEMWHMADTMNLMQQIGAKFRPPQTT